MAIELYVAIELYSYKAIKGNIELYSWSVSWWVDELMSWWELRVDELMSWWEAMSVIWHAGGPANSRIFYKTIRKFAGPPACQIMDITSHQPINPSTHRLNSSIHQPINSSVQPINPSTRRFNPSIHQLIDSTHQPINSSIQPINPSTDSSINRLMYQCINVLMY